MHYFEFVSLVFLVEGCVILGLELRNGLRFLVVGSWRGHVRCGRDRVRVRGGDYTVRRLAEVPSAAVGCFHLLVESARND